MTTRLQLSKKTRFQIFERDKFTCQYCGKQPPQVCLEVDHIIPVSKNGTNDAENLTTSCQDCNRGKTNKLISQSPSNTNQAARCQEALEAISIAKIFAKAAKARQKTRQLVCDELCYLTGKNEANKSNVTQVVNAIEKVGIDKTLFYLSESARITGRGHLPSETDLMRYFCGCIGNYRKDILV